MTAFLSVCDVDIHYGSTKVLKNINLDVEKNEFVALLGGFWVR